MQPSPKDIEIQNDRTESNEFLESESEFVDPDEEPESLSVSTEESSSNESETEAECENQIGDKVHDVKQKNIDCGSWQFEDQKVAQVLIEFAVCIIFDENVCVCVCIVVVETKKEVSIKKEEKQCQIKIEPI